VPETVTSNRPGSSGMITIGGRHIPIRRYIFWAGAAFWIGNMILRTGTSGIAELWVNLSFMAELVIITCATRTITLDRVAG
jgi:hypothetical protein